MVKGNKIGYGLIIIFLVFLLSGCGKLEVIDKKLGEVFFEEQASSSVSLLERIKEVEISTSTTDETKDSLQEDIKAEELTKEQKEKIEQWLESEGLNRYGDEPGTYYERGTPLIDEEGIEIERFEYILEKHPELKKVL